MKTILKNGRTVYFPLNAPQIYRHFTKACKSLLTFFKKNFFQKVWGIFFLIDKQFFTTYLQSIFELEEAGFPPYSLGIRHALCMQSEPAHRR